jgi:hypothetical protein
MQIKIVFRRCYHSESIASSGTQRDFFRASRSSRRGLSFPPIILFLPRQRNPTPQLPQAQAIVIVVREQRLNDVGSQRRQLEHSSGVTAIDAFGVGQFFQAGVLTGLQFLLPLLGSGNRESQSVVLRF